MDELSESPKLELPETPLPRTKKNWKIPIGILLGLAIIIMGGFITRSCIETQNRYQAEFFSIVNEMDQRQKNESIASENQFSEIRISLDQLRQTIKDSEPIQEPCVIPTSQAVASSSPLILGLRFRCVDSVSMTQIDHCQVNAKVISSQITDEFTLNSSNFDSAKIILPIRIRLSINASAEGYKSTGEIFEYLETGEEQIHDLQLSKP